MIEEVGKPCREGEQSVMLGRAAFFERLREDSLNRRPVHLDNVSLSHWGLFPIRSEGFEYRGGPNSQG